MAHCTLSPAATSIALPDGPTLRLSFVAPSPQPEAFKLVVLLHPWSFLGGRMTDHVLQLLSPVFLDAGYHTLIYNSRGIGGSSGWPSLSGFNEGRDLGKLLEAALAYAGSRPIESIIILGYSHGSLIATLHPSSITTSAGITLPVHRIILSYPLAYRGLLTLFNTSAYQGAVAALVDPSGTSVSHRVLIIYGTEDQFTPQEALEAWSSGLSELATKAHGGGKLSIVEIENGDHFWGGRQVASQLCERVQEWLRSL